MKIGFPGAARPAYYDRQIVTIKTGPLYAGVAPHGQTLRNLYTVPAARLLYLGVMCAGLSRATAAAPVGVAQAEMSPSNSIVLRAYLRTNGVGDQSDREGGSGIVLAAADTMNFYTEDSSTGGTVDYYAGWLGTEFSA